MFERSLSFIFQFPPLEFHISANHWPFNPFITRVVAIFGLIFNPFPNSSIFPCSLSPCFLVKFTIYLDFMPKIFPAIRELSMEMGSSYTPKCREFYAFAFMSSNVGLTRYMTASQMGSPIAIFVRWSCWQPNRNRLSWCDHNSVVFIIISQRMISFAQIHTAIYVSVCMEFNDKTTQKLNCTAMTFVYHRCSLCLNICNNSSMWVGSVIIVSN